MDLISTPRIDFLRGLATEILHNYKRGRTIVAVDGADGAGAGDFADDLARVFEERQEPSFRASLRHFQRSRAELDRFAPAGPERPYRNGHDYSTLRRVLVEPFRMGGSTGFVTGAYDPDRDAWIEPTWLTGPPDATLIFDGDFLLRPELRGIWSYSILLETAPQTQSDRLYLAESIPRDVASAVVDNTDAAAPRRVFLDSC